MKFPAADYPWWKLNLKACCCFFYPEPKVWRKISSTFNNHIHQKTPWYRLKYEKCAVRTANCLYSILFFFFFHGIITPSQPAFSLSVVGYTSACFTLLCSEPSNVAADSGDGCLHCGMYEIKRKSLINWQQAPQDREAGDGMINLTRGWSAGPLRRGWWIYSRVRCLPVKMCAVLCVLCFIWDLHVYTLCTLFFFFFL